MLHNTTTRQVLAIFPLTPDQIRVEVEFNTHPTQCRSFWRQSSQPIT